MLLYAVSNTQFGGENRWFQVGEHHSRHAAHWAFRDLCKEYPSRQVILLLVASVHDPETGRFRDVIVESRGVAPLIDRKRLERLTRLDRPLIARATDPPRPGAPRRATPLPPSRPGRWLTVVGGALAAVAVLVALWG